MADPYISALTDNIWIAIVMFLFIWIFSWAKGALGSAKLAIIFAIIIIFLTVFQYPELVWLGVILFVFAVFGKDFFSKLDLKLDRP
ncbi:MAG TPA: hypothetical protein VJK05_05025 [archaeon]|nr:hypothetical protein [archaeon]